MTLCLKMMGPLALLVLLTPTYLHASAFAEIRGDGVIVHYEPALQEAAGEIARGYQTIRKAVEKKTGWKAGFVASVYLVSRAPAFHEITSHDLITAYAVPGKNAIVIDYSKMGRTPFDLRDTLGHEISHLLLHEHIVDERLPKWLDEGVAQWASGGRADILNPGSKDILKQAVLSGNVLPLKDIHHSFPAHKHGMLLAYEQSKNLVEFLVGEYGEDSLRSVLTSLKGGSTVEEAVSDHLGTTLSVLEANWKKSMQESFTWEAYLADNIYWVLFLFAALITVIAYVKFRHRLKHYRDDEEEDSTEQSVE